MFFFTKSNPQKHKGNHTPARATNTGLTLATGDYIVALASDDKLSPDYLEKCLNQFTEPKIGIVYTGCKEFGASNAIRKPRKPRHRFSVYREPHGQIGAMMVRREVYLGSRRRFSWRVNCWIWLLASYKQLVRSRNWLSYRCSRWVSMRNGNRWKLCHTAHGRKGELNYDIPRKK